MDQLGRESFSLSRSSFNFSSSFVLDELVYASCQQQHVQQLDSRNKLNGLNDAFIELDLRPSLAATDKEEELDYFRISFSDLVPFPGSFRPSSINSGASDHIPQGHAADNHMDSGPHDSTLISCNRQSNYPTTTVSIFPSSPVDDHEAEDYADDCRPISSVNSWKLVRSSKASSSSSSSSSAAKIKNSSGAVNGGIMNSFLVKMRCIISGLRMGLSSMGASLIQQPCCRARNPGVFRINAFMKKPFNKLWFTNWPCNHQLTTMRPLSSAKVGLDQTTKLDAMRKLLIGSSCAGVMSPLIKNTKGGSRSSRSRLNKSCSTSIQSSPVHQLRDLSLVHAAIVHCNKSFRGETDQTDI